MKTLAEWLVRGEKPKKVRKPLPRVTPKRAKQNREYSVRRKAFLGVNRICCAGPMLGWNNCSMRSDDVHHRAGRLGGNFLNESTWIAVCRSCHDYIHTHPKEARSLGLLV